MSNKEDKRYTPTKEEKEDSVSQSVGNPLKALTLEIIQEERRYLYSDQGTIQRKKNIKKLIAKAHKSGKFVDDNEGEV